MYWELEGTTDLKDEELQPRSTKYWKGHTIVRIPIQMQDLKRRLSDPESSG